MTTTIDISLVVDTLLASPGMSETVKINLSVSRKTVLLLTRCIEKGLQSLQTNEAGSAFPEFARKESLSELEGIVADSLQKAGLTELNEKLKALSAQ
ncbi:hypothetical protein [Dyadobacter frigoris]|uniref:Uncharacterized protein n=1 Tax=Dyadobacter frigoris TaxID=2576211 RepID=A0A4U6CKW5_9BACT|nr:hypothetical protein [Dyadobacter frigoris]TKT84890.1 hypothetical protein FDK13_34565 [Dyadobacter frigoris]